MKLKEKVVLVTGSSRGIGKATIIEFAKNGANVVINYKNSEKAAEELKTYVEKTFDVKALAIKADVTKEEDRINMVNKIIEIFGSIDVLVNNAGIAIDKDMADRTEDDFNTTLSTNLVAPFYRRRN
jgi:3-oxoacyl-[acyl-carrier protein] reductase